MTHRVTSRLTETVIDCADPARLADFWCAVLGYVVITRREELVEIAPSARPDADVLADLRREPTLGSLLFVAVPDGEKTTKNRLHLDLSPIDCSQAAEVERLEGLGARRVDIGQGEQRWVVMADPEGNEFCVLRSLAPGEFSL